MGIAYKIQNGDIVKEDDIVLNPLPVFIVPKNEVECPAVVFVYLRYDAKEN